MSGTPQTDDIARGNHVVPTEWAQQLERERDEAREELEKAYAKHDDTCVFLCQTQELCNEYLDAKIKAERERDEAREVNTKLRDIAERAINYLDQSYRDGFSDEVSDFRYELEQLKEETK